MTKYQRFVLGALFALWSTAAAAQSELGRIAGTVRDQSAAFVAGATVLVTNDRTAETRTIQADREGKFLVGSLKPSTYTIRVRCPASPRRSTARCRSLSARS